jgi:predicted ArsR family transcriptional regulator
MPGRDVHARFFESSRGRIVDALRLHTMTSNELSRRLGQRTHAIRAQLRGMERDGLVEVVGLRAGRTRPFAVFRLTAQVEQLLSRAYIPFLLRLLRVFAKRHSLQEFETVMRDTGRALAEDFGGRVRGRSLSERLAAASRLLNEELGAVTHVENDSTRMAIRGAGCPLSALADKNPGACLAIETLLTISVRIPVKECCDRTGRPRCCFRVESSK